MTLSRSTQQVRHGAESNRYTGLGKSGCSSNSNYLLVAQNRVGVEPTLPLLEDDSAALSLIRTRTVI